MINGERPVEVTSGGWISRHPLGNLMIDFILPLNYSYIFVPTTRYHANYKKKKKMNVGMSNKYSSETRS